MLKVQLNCNNDLINHTLDKIYYFNYISNTNFIQINFFNLFLFLFIFSFFFLKIKNNVFFFNAFITLNIVQFTDLKNNLITTLIGFGLLYFIATIFDFNYLLVIAILLIQPVIITPLLYLSTFSLNSLLCINLCQKKSITATLVNDFIAIFSFCLRFVSQYIRIILITAVFILLFEFLNTNFFAYTLSTNIFSLNNSFLVVLRLLVEFIDCFFILIVQFTTFFTVLL